MMASVYVFASSLCISLVLCALVRMFAPSGATSKILSVVIGMFMLCSMISPVCSLVKNFNMDEGEVFDERIAKNLAASYDNEVLTRTTNYINEYANSILESISVKPDNIKTVVAVSESKGIYIKEISIYINKTDVQKSDEIVRMLEDSLGCKPQIISE